MNQGDGTFGDAVYYVLRRFRCISTADFNGDGLLDVVVAGERQTGKFSLHLSNGDGSLAPALQHQFTETGGRPISIVGADVTGDGVPDVSVLDNYQRKLVVLKYDRITSEFTQHFVHAFNEQPQGVSAVDVDGDHDLDLVVHSYIEGDANKSIQVLANDGEGDFSLLSSIADLVYPSYLAFGDIDLDGDQDFVANVVAGDKLTYVYLNNGSGVFTSAQTIPFAHDGQRNNVELTDINSDGWVDLIVVQGDTSRIAVHINDQGVFEHFVDLSAGGIPTPIESGDLDGDSDQDLIVGHISGGSNNIHVFNNLLGEINQSTSRTFDVTVNPVNDVPTINAIADVMIDERCRTNG